MARWLALLSLFVVPVASGQVVYTDVEPDVAVIPVCVSCCQGFCPPQYYDEHLLQVIPGAATLRLAVSSGGSGMSWGTRARVEASASGTLAVVGSVPPFGLASRLQAGVLIGPQNVSPTSSALLGSYSWSSGGNPVYVGEWIGTDTQLQEGYVGIGLVDSSGVRRFAWLHLRASAYRIYLLAYAYEQTPDRPIVAGDSGTTTSLPPEPPGSEGTLRLSPNPVTGSAEVRVQVPTPQHVRVVAYDLLGREVALVYDGFVQHERVILFDTGHFRPGTYLLRATGPTFSRHVRATVLH